MVIGVPKEIKDQEYRVGMIPAGVQTLTARGHHILIEQGAGGGAGITDEEYAEVGAELVAAAAEIYARAEMVCKVKEPLPSEYGYLQSGRFFSPFSILLPPSNSPRPSSSGTLWRLRMKPSKRPMAGNRCSSR